MEKINKDNVLLSICIPTFNRSKYLKCALDSIVKQYNNNFEVCISDNASDDETRVCVQQYQNSYSFINYSRNDKNLGFDKNIIKVVGMAKGKYVWMVGDDDMIFNDGVIPKIYEELQKYESLDFLLFNLQLCDINMKPISNNSYKVHKGMNKNYNIKTKNDIVELFENCRYLGYTFGFIGGFIFLKKRWDRIEDNFHVEHGYIHLIKAWSILSSSSTKVRYINDKLICVRTGNDHMVSQVGYCFRAVSDLRRISSYIKVIWPDCDKMLESTMKLVKNELDSVYKNLKNCTGMRALSTQKDWVYFYTTYKSYFGSQFPYSFVNMLPDFLFDILHYLIRKFKLIDEKFIIPSRKKRKKICFPLNFG